MTEIKLLDGKLTALRDAAEYIRNDEAYVSALAEIEAVESTIRSLQAERRKRTEPYSEECRAAISELEERFSTDDDIVELCSIEFVYQQIDALRDSILSAIKDKAEEWDKSATPMREVKVATAHELAEMIRNDRC